MRPFRASSRRVERRTLPGASAPRHDDLDRVVPTGDVGPGSSPSSRHEVDRASVSSIDQRPMGVARVDPRRRGRDRQGDPVGHGEVGVAAGLLDEPDQVAGVPSCSSSAVTSMSRTITPAPVRRARRWHGRRRRPGRVGTRLDAAVTADRTTPSPSSPVARLVRLDDVLDVLAEPRAELGRHELQHLVGDRGRRRR